MFIVSKRNYLVIRADGSVYKIKRDYIGEIPEDVAESDLVQRAILGGNIAVPESTRDKELYKADEAAGKLAAEHDIRQIRKLQRIQRKQPGIKRKSDDHVAVWKYKPNGCEV